MFKAFISAVVVCSFLLPAAAAALQVGDPAPDLHVSRWWNGPAAGRLSEPGDAVHVLAFWATWSQPARESLATLSALQAELAPQGVRLIAVTDETPAAIEGCLDGLQAAKSLLIAADDQGQTTAGWLQAAGQAALPHAFVVDRQGRVAWHGHPDEVSGIVEQVLAGTFDMAQAKQIHEVAQQFEKQESADRAQPEREAPVEAPSPAQLRRLLARAVQTGEWAQAVKLIDSLLEQLRESDDSGEVPSLLGTKFVFLYEMLEQYPDAETTARRLLDLQQDEQTAEATAPYAEALNTVAWTLLARGDFEQLGHRWPEIAHETARRALEVSSRKSSAIIDTYARSLYMLGYIESAGQWQERAMDQAQQELDQARQEGATEDFVLRCEHNLRTLQTGLDYYRQVLQYRQRSEQ